MKRIIRLTESDLTRIVKRVISEQDDIPMSIDKKLLSDFFMVKNDFQYLKNHNGMEIYDLKRKGFTVVVAVKIPNDTSKVSIAIFLKFPMGKSINYLEEVRGVQSMTLSINDYNGMTNLIQRSIDFGKSQDDYDNLPPLPR